jgi:hypothetical protein
MFAIASCSAAGDTAEQAGVGWAQFKDQKHRERDADRAEGERRNHQTVRLSE